MRGDTLDIAAWTLDEITEECKAERSAYIRALNVHYAAYFLKHPNEASAHPQKAATIEAALPPGWEHLAEQLPASERHDKYLSGKSSQILALGILGAATALDSSLGWLLETLHPAPPPLSGLAKPDARLEQPLHPGLLNERPRVTAVDYLVEDNDAVMCLEAELSESGLGVCSCSDPSTAQCSKARLKRTLYWQSAADDLGLPPREEGRQCPVHTPYQAVRNVAAARALAGPDRVPIFALLYDQRNPAFAGAGRWPGWPRVLDSAINERSPGRVRFCSASWQELVGAIPQDDAVITWATEKHQLV